MHTLQVISENWVSAGQESKTLLFLQWVGGNEVHPWAGGGGRECHEVKRLSNISLHKSCCGFLLLQYLMRSAFSSVKKNKIQMFQFLRLVV